MENLWRIKQSGESILWPAFPTVLDDDELHKEPFGFELATVVVNGGITREIITKMQMRKFLKWTASIKLVIESMETNVGTRKLLWRRMLKNASGEKTWSRWGLKR